MSLSSYGSFLLGETMRENVYQAGLRKRIEARLPGCLIIKNDPNLRQGILDLQVLFGRRWAMLEVKAYRLAPSQPNQGYYVDLLNEMSYAAIIHPENEEVILDELERALRDQ
jgi:hypothetical protein